MGVVGNVVGGMVMVLGFLIFFGASVFVPRMSTFFRREEKKG